jgi:hypothetical protein
MDIKKIANVILAIFLILSGVYFAIPIVMTYLWFMYLTGALGIIAGLLWLFAAFKGK